MGKSSGPLRKYEALAKGAGLSLIFYVILQWIIFKAEFADREFRIEEVVLLKVEHIISIATALVSAMSLSAILLEIIKRSEQEAEERKKIALRFDDLLAEFYQPHIRRARDDAFKYLKFLEKDPKLYREFVAGWVEGAQNLPPFEGKPASRFEWAISIMVSFYVRLENRISAEFELTDETIENFEQILGPFYFEYWKVHMQNLCDNCAAYVSNNEDCKFPRPYFIESIRRLIQRADNHHKNGAKPSAPST